MTEEIVKDYWDQFLASLPPDHLAVVKSVAQTLARHPGSARSGTARLSW